MKHTCHVSYHYFANHIRFCLLGRWYAKCSVSVHIRTTTMYHTAHVQHYLWEWWSRWTWKSKVNLPFNWIVPTSASYYSMLTPNLILKPRTLKWITGVSWVLNLNYLSENTINVTIPQWNNKSKVTQHNVYLKVHFKHEYSRNYYFYLQNSR